MANKEHWEVKDEREMWQKVVGKEQEDHFETAKQAEQIFSGIPDGEDCLEIGCGVGRFRRWAMTHFVRYVGADSSPSILQYGYAFRPGAHLVETNGEYIPFTDGFFDFVFSFTCFQHMPTLEMVQANISEAYRVLAPGGRCRVQTVLGTPDPDYFDGWVFPSPEAFAKEFEAAGFTIEDAHIDDLWIWVTAKR